MSLAQQLKCHLKQLKAFKLQMLNGSLGFVIIISAICILLHFFVPESTLAYRYSDISQGQWWRLITGNLMHTNHWHLAMNIAGLWVISFLYQFNRILIKLLFLFSVLCLMEGLGLYWFYPNLQGYVGLSGVLHGLFAYGAVREIFLKIKMGYFLLLGVIAKTAYEQFFGASSEVSQMIGARVATEAHLIGMISGVLIAVTCCMLSKAQKSNKNKI